MTSHLPHPDDTDRHRSTVTHEAGTPVVATRVDPVLVETPGSAHTQQVDIDYAAERYAALSRLSQLISFIFGVIVALIALRVVLKLIAANPASPFAQFIYGLTDLFVAPFVGLTATPSAGGAVLELSSLIAAVVYALVGWALVKLVWLLFYRPASRSTSSRTYHHS